MGRKRTKKENKGLPERWVLDHGAYYYMVPSGKEDIWDGKKKFRLGKTLPESYATWSQRIEFSGSLVTVSQLIARYEIEILSAKTPSIQNKEGNALINLRKVFGKMKITSVEPIDIYGYLDNRGRKFVDENGIERGGYAVANREIELFSTLFRKAVKWGAIKKHPFKGEIEKHSLKPRTRYIENWELKEFLSLKPKKKKGDSVPFIQAYTNLKVISGLRKQDLLSIQMSQLEEKGIRVKPLKTRHNTGKEYILEWTPALREAIDICIAVRPCLSQNIFCNRRGESYYKVDAKTPSSGFDSIWQRYMKRALEETKLTESFTEHDLRAKSASDLEDDNMAQKLLGHSDVKTTRRNYRRKIEIVKPSR